MMVTLMIGQIKKTKISTKSGERETIPLRKVVRKLPTRAPRDAAPSLAALFRGLATVQ
jgi:hypothetical protein